MTNVKTRHHHGDLKRALIEAGLELLEEGGLEALTLRKCAARAGVSHAAPAHHFDGLPGLISAISEAGFDIFSKHMSDEIEVGNQSDIGRLRSICRGYLQFGMTHSGLLKVMFGEHGLAIHAPRNNREEAEAYLLLRRACAPFVPPGEDPHIVEAQVWSLIHGFTLLYLSGEFGTPLPEIEDGPFAAVMALVERVGTQGKT
ncbi:TetR/AcrR family transcriptional regulator [Shimia sp. NS0008-38b]|uniref:TetR-like C-terminal domain-containing protein n=1 Tax=Shimia sp. NS0008-38b TaxID=3127653 RepID=UPI0031096D42